MDLRCSNPKTLAVNSPVLGPDIGLDVRCGRCPACWAVRKMDWRNRLVLEQAYNPITPIFVTLTYAPDHLPDSCDEGWERLRLFLQNIRRNYGKVRYFLCTEYGNINTKRIHHHGILWIDNDVAQLDAQTAVKSCWKYGFVKAELVRSAKAFGYVTKYITKSDKYFFSRRPGLGRRYVARWQRFIQGRHARGLLSHYSDLGKSYKFKVECLGKQVKVRIPEPIVRETLRNLGVRSIAPENTPPVNRGSQIRKALLHSRHAKEE